MSQAEFDVWVKEHINPKLLTMLSESELKDLWVAWNIGPTSPRDKLMQAVYTHRGITKVSGIMAIPDTRPKEERQAERKAQFQGRGPAGIPRAPLPERYEIPFGHDDKGNPVIPDQADLVQFFKENFEFAVIRDNAAKGQDLLVEWNRVYKLDGQALARQILSNSFPDIKQSTVNEVIATIRNQTPVFRDEFDQNHMILNCKNTLVDLESGRAIDDPTYKSLIQIDAVFDPNVGESDIFLELLDKATPGHQRIILEIMGSALTNGGINLEKALVLVGDGSNGKSTILGAFEAVLGKDNVSNSDMYEIQEPFGAADLVNKLANISTEIPERKDVKSFAREKKIISKEPIRINQKFVRPYHTTVNAVLFYACNEMPPLPRVSESVLKRYFIVECTQKFPHNEDFKRALHSETEKSRILNTLLAALQRLIKNGGQISQTQNTKETLTLWKGDLIDQFLEDCLKDSDDPVGPTQTETHTAYKVYCTQRGRDYAAQREFNKRLKEYGYESAPRTKNGKSKRCWLDVELTDPSPPDPAPGQTVLTDSD